MSSLPGRRGWTAVVSLTAVLGALVTAQLPVANAAPTPGVRGSADRAAGVAPSLADVDGTRLSRRPGAVPPQAAVSRAAVVTRAVRVLAPVATAPAPAAVRMAGSRPTTRRPVARAAATRAVPRTAPGLCSGPGWQQRRGEAALASLRGGTGSSGYTVSFEPARRGVLGLTYLDAKRIELFVRGCEVEPTELLRHVAAHELGHAQDTERMSAASRVAWLQARGIAPGTPWYGCDRCSDFATPAGDFAEVYAQWARAAGTNSSRLAGDVPPALLAALAGRFFR